MRTEIFENRPFEADVSRLLHMMVHSVYSGRDVFLRELISNAADACEKLRYEAIAAPELLGGDPALAITIAADPEAGTLAIADNGIGMSHDELIEALGTIARSGTRSFMDRIAGRRCRPIRLSGFSGLQPSWLRDGLFERDPLKSGGSLSLDDAGQTP